MEEEMREIKIYKTIEVYVASSFSPLTEGFLTEMEFETYDDWHWVWGTQPLDSAIEFLQHLLKDHKIPEINYRGELEPIIKMADGYFGRPEFVGTIWNRCHLTEREIIEIESRIRREEDIFKNRVLNPEQNWKLVFTINLPKNQHTKAL